MKRLVSLLLTFALLFTAVPMSVSAKEVQIEVAGCDRSRDAGKLVVYTDNYGDTTATNQWGAEAIVDSSHRVIALMNGNSEIPDGGFVVSGHDDETSGGKRMKTWVQENIRIGDYVYFNRRTSTLTVSDKPLDDEVSPFFSFDNPVDGVNTARGTDDMILYTPDHGATTGTNEYGYEIVVEDGVITSLGGNDNAIPANGFVISMHGATSRWMKLKLVKGMSVTYDPDTLNVIFNYDAEGVQKAASYALTKAQSAIESAKASFVYADYAAAEAKLEALRADYQAAVDAYRTAPSDIDLADSCDLVVAEADTLVNGLCDSYPVHYRGVWIRPTQKSAKAVEAYIKQLHEASINFVCVEGWFENGVIMEVPEDSLFRRHPSFNYDVLQAYIDACDKYGMECHLWMPIMNIGSYIDNGYEERTVPGQRPEWLSLNNQGQPYNKDGFMMIDPANEDAKAYLLDFYKYIVTNYEIDAFEMDYIRYYAATGEADFGYTDAAFEGFEAAYGYGVTPRYDMNADYWNDWCQYRRDLITEWVRDIRAMLDEEAPDMLLSADVAFPFEHALDKVYQNFPQWLEEGLIDILHPMAYGDGFGDDICRAVELAGDRCIVVTGLGAQTDMLGATELERQARENDTYGAYGECYFESQSYLKDQVPAAVSQTVYRTEAIPPFKDTDAAVAALLDFMVTRIDEVILPMNGMTDSEATAVKDAVTAAKSAITDGAISSGAASALHTAVDAVSNEAARQTLGRDLARAERIAAVKHHQPTPADGANGLPPVAWIAIGVGTAVLLAAAIVLIAVRRRKDR